MAPSGVTWLSLDQFGSLWASFVSSGPICSQWGTLESLWGTLGSFWRALGCLGSYCVFSCRLELPIPGQWLSSPQLVDKSHPGGIHSRISDQLEVRVGRQLALPLPRPGGRDDGS